MIILNEKGTEVDNLDLGIVEAEKSKDYLYYIYNNSSARVIDLKVEIPYNEVKILFAPDSLEPYEKGELKIRWSPTLTIKKGLKTLIKISGTELYE